MSHVIIGTAGHIDHGKSALVKALTGTDPDRLKEEKERGLTIDLGFAFLGDKAAIIDVPGHERFIKNMVAGVSTIDMVLFVVAADDGVMPQTREHLDILDLLQVKRGLIVLTKADLVDEEWLELVKSEVIELVKGTFLEEAEIIAASGTTGAGVEDVRRALDDLFQKVEARKDQGIFWLPVDRSFTVRGFGTVVTGSVLSGKANVGDELELIPRQRRLRVRGLQTHGQDAKEVQIGDRAALNLGGVRKDEITRGDILATPGYFSSTRLLDARLRLLATASRPLGNRTRIRLHVGTRELIARVILLDTKQLAPGESGYVQLRLEEIAGARRMDPFVIRQYSPTLTIGGGVILDPNPRVHRRFRQDVLAHLKSLEQESPAEVIDAHLRERHYFPLTPAQIAKDTGIVRNVVDHVLEEMATSGKALQLGTPQQPSYALETSIARVKEEITARLIDFHNKYPLKTGVPRSELRELVNPKLDNAILGLALDALSSKGTIKQKGTVVALQSHEIKLSAQDESLRKRLAEVLRKARFTTPNPQELAAQSQAKPDDVSRVLSAMQGVGEVLKLEGDLYFHRDSVTEAKSILQKEFPSDQEISVSAFRERLGTSRRYALAILLHLDEIGLTERIGETRILRSAN